MGGKILDENNKVIFEFEDGQPVATLLAAFIQKAKFGEKFENVILFNPWIHDLLKASIEQRPYLEEIKPPTGAGAPDWFLKDGMNETDWALREFLSEFTLHVQTSIDELQDCDWKNLSRAQRANFLNLGLFPHIISDARLNDMIEDIDAFLQSAIQAFNPDYTHDE